MRILVIEDSEKLRTALQRGLEKEGFGVDAVGDGERGLVFARRQHYDVVLLDLLLPGLSGLDVLARLRAEGSKAYVLILTALDAVEERIAGLEGGADDYLVKPFAFAELVARIRALIRRRYDRLDPVLRVGDLVIDTRAKTVTRAGVDVRVTQRELKILEFLALREGAVCSRVEIEDHIYTEESLPASNAVDSAICLLRKKLAVDGAAGELIHTYPRRGYALRAEP